MNAPEAPGLPRDDAGAPVFAEVWQARAFALATHLAERGAFAWGDFTAALGAQIARQPPADYYAAWLAALEALLDARGIAEQRTVDATTQAWQDAARATPHGMAIRLENAARRD